MNCIPGLTIADRLGRAFHAGPLLGTAVLLVACTACGAPISEVEAPDDSLTYGVLYHVVPDASAGTISVTLELDQERALLRELRVRHDARVSNIAGDGELARVVVENQPAIIPDLAKLESLVKEVA